MITDGSGTPVSRFAYGAYGQAEVALDTLAQPYRYTGREYDTETGLHHYRARAYDAATGRFLQEDPIWFAAGDLNVYRYTWNNPANWTDPSGMTAVAGGYGRAAAAGAGAVAARYILGAAVRRQFMLATATRSGSFRAVGLKVGQGGGQVTMGTINAIHFGTAAHAMAAASVNAALAAVVYDARTGILSGTYVSNSADPQQAAAPNPLAANRHKTRSQTRKIPDIFPSSIPEPDDCLGNYVACIEGRWGPKECRDCLLACQREGCWNFEMCSPDSVPYEKYFNR